MFMTRELGWIRRGHEEFQLVQGVQSQFAHLHLYQAGSIERRQLFRYGTLIVVSRTQNSGFSGMTSYQVIGEFRLHLDLLVRGHYQGFMPNLDDKVVNLSTLTGLCTTGVSLIEVSTKIVLKPLLEGKQRDHEGAYFSSSIGPLRASTLPYFLFLVAMS